jgi:hypothetical protein
MGKVGKEKPGKGPKLNPDKGMYFKSTKIT